MCSRAISPDPPVRGVEPWDRSRHGQRRAIFRRVCAAEWGSLVCGGLTFASCWPRFGCSAHVRDARPIAIQRSPRRTVPSLAHLALACHAGPTPVTPL
jgi:hypothetical protein